MDMVVLKNYLNFNVSSNKLLIQIGTSSLFVFGAKNQKEKNTNLNDLKHGKHCKVVILI